MKTALMLAGGGARGILQVGYLKAWLELGLQYETLYCSSVGALNGLLLHQGEFDKLEDLWLNIKTDDVYLFNAFTLWNMFTPKACVFDSSPLYKLIKKYVNYDKLAANKTKMVINTTDFTNWKPYSLDIHSLNKDNIADFLRASSSPPLAFEPVHFENKILVDAGIINNYSINSAAKDGHDTMVVMTPTRVEPKAKVNNIIDMLDLMTSVPEYGYFDRELGCVEKINHIIDQVNEVLEPDFRKIKISVVIPDKPTGIELLNFNYKQDRKELIKLGYDLAKDILKRDLLSLD